MEHQLINTIVASIVLAFICGFIARKIKFPALFGYLIAGIIIGPFTPGYVADTSMAQQLAEVGIILLMFGVGLHFSFKDLGLVQKIALPGAFFQMSSATVIGCAVLMASGFSMKTGIIFGLSLSCASTIVLLRALEERGLVETTTGKIAVGWLIVEDIAMVMALVLLPVMTGINGVEKTSYTRIGIDISMVFVKLSLFTVLMVYFGRRLLPRLLQSIAKVRSSEITTLGTLAISMGFAFIAYTVFDASFALGAFMAGFVLSESEVGQKAAEKSLPMRDAFSVIFFVSVGMLFDPQIVLTHPFMVLATLGIIIIGKSAAAMVITKIFRQPLETSLVIAISLAQIGEFSFILAGLAFKYNLLDKDVFNLVLAGSIFSIALNPFLFKWLDSYFVKKGERQKERSARLDHEI